MDTITTIGLDIAKSVFQVHDIDQSGVPVVRRQLKCRQVIEQRTTRSLATPLTDPEFL